MSESKSRPGSASLMMIVCGTVVMAALMVSCDNIRKAKARAGMAEDLGNLKQVKFALDGFATDFDGQYPNGDTHEKITENAPAPITSNDYFRQLFMAQATESESIFWVKGASVCSKDPPDDVVREGQPNVRGPLVPDQILQKGDCGIAYILDQTQVSDVRRAVLLSAYKAGTNDFDPNLYGTGDTGKVLVVRIDGSAKPERLDANGKLLDDDGADLLKDSKCWAGTPPVIVQPAQ